MKKRIGNPVLVTGASGFIGSNLTRRLVEEGKKVYLLLRKESDRWRIQDILSRVTVLEGDLTDKEKVFRIARKIRPRSIFHLAAYGSYLFQEDVSKIMTVNLNGTMNLVSACEEVGFDCFIHSGTSSEYGFKKTAMKETDLLEPNSYYAVSKAAASLFCQYTAKTKNLPIVILRYFSVYGPYEEPSRLVPTLVRSMLVEKCPPLVSADTVRDFIFIDDVVDAILSAAQYSVNGGEGEIFNIGTGKQTTLREIVSMVLKLTGADVEVKWETMSPRIWDQNIWQASISKAKKIMDWKSQFELYEGLKKTITWAKNNPQFAERKKSEM